MYPLIKQQKIGNDHNFILFAHFSIARKKEMVSMITQDIVKKLWNEAGNGNIAVWNDDTMTVVPTDYCGEPDGRKPLVILKPIALVNKYDFLDFALCDEELLNTIETQIRAAGGMVTRAPK
jgi:hypothetical protein